MKQSYSHPPLALGTWALAGDAPWGYGPCSAEDAKTTIRAALAAGCRHIDTAPMFGNGRVETLLGELLGDRPEVAITTRVGCRVERNHPVADFAPEAIPRQLAESTERLGRVPERVLLHTPPPGVLRDKQALRTLINLREQGLAGQVGVSVFEPEAGRIAIDNGADWVCIPYNPANRKPERALFAAAQAAGCRVQVREVLHNGRLTDRPRALKGLSPADVRKEWPPLLDHWLHDVGERIRAAVPERTLVQCCIGYGLGHPQVDMAVVGCRGAAQVAAAFGDVMPLTRGQRQAIDQALYNDL